MSNAWTIIGLWFVASVIIGLVAGRLIDRMGGDNDQPG